MRSPIRFLLLWLIALALPLQGVAAAIGHCAAMSRSMPPSPSPSMHTAASMPSASPHLHTRAHDHLDAPSLQPVAGRLDADTPSHGLANEAMAASPIPAACDHATHAAHASGTAGDGNCCGVAAAVAMPVLASPWFVSAAPQATPRAPRVPAAIFLTDGLERPPRPALG